MTLTDLSLLGFRSHSDTSLTFGPKINLLLGPNGAGKTNILEAIHYLCLSKSFLVSNDQYAVRKGVKYFEVKGTFSSQEHHKRTARIVFMPGTGKRLFINGVALERLADVVGRFPVVSFVPGDQILTSGGPEERRRFLNNILSQAHPVYLDDVLKYQRALRQRNELLSQARRTGHIPAGSLLDSWNQELAELGSRVVYRRLKFTLLFAAYLERAYRLIESVAEHPTLTYTTFSDFEADDEQETIKNRYREKLEKSVDKALMLGRTLSGPHRDEIVFRLDRLEVRRYASQGQHRTFGMALKLAQYFYLKDQLEESPLLLLDDIFDNLDHSRRHAFLGLLETDTIGQSIITAANDTLFRGSISFDNTENKEINIPNQPQNHAPAPVSDPSAE